MAEIKTVEKQADGTILFTHGHRFPDNIQTVEQRHNAQGRLLSAKVQWSGFAGEVLNVTATFDEHGKLTKEEGFRAPEMTTPVTELLKPLPPEALQAGPPAAHADPSVGEGLRKIYAPAARPGSEELDGSDN